MRLARAALASLAAVVALGIAPRAGRAEDDGAVRVREVSNLHREGWAAIRAVDAATGKGIPGAWLADDFEATHPMGALHDGARAFTGDDDGWIGGPEDDVRWTSYLGAPGYGTTDDPPEIATLGRAVDLPVRLTDALGRPVVGARLGYRLKCGHCRDLVEATTDERGVAVLRGVDPRVSAWVWPTAEGVEGEDLYLDDVGAREWAPGEPPLELTTLSSATAEGRVLDVAGRPVVGAFVGNRTWHRGPWTRTDERGRFRLVGARGPLQVDPDDDAFEPERRVPEPMPGVPVVVRLDGSALVAPDLVPWAVQVVERGTGRAAEGIVVRAARRADGWADQGVVDERGYARMRLAPGTQLLVVGDAASPWRVERREVVVAREREGEGEEGRNGEEGQEGGEERTERVEVEPWPEVRVDASALPEEDARVEIVTATAVRDVTTEARAGAVRVPVTSLVGLRVSPRVGAAVGPVVLVPPARGPDVPVVRLPWRASPTVRLRLTDAAGNAVRAWAEVRRGRRMGDTMGPESAFVLPVAHAGACRVVVMPEREDLAAVRVPFSAPSAGGADVDLGTVVLPARAARTLVLLGTDGAAETGSWTETLEENALLAPDAGLEERGRLDFEEGLVVRVGNERGDLFPYVRRLEGPGPWTLRGPRARWRSWRRRSTARPSAASSPRGRCGVPRESGAVRRAWARRRAPPRRRVEARPADGRRGDVRAGGGRDAACRGDASPAAGGRVREGGRGDRRGRECRWGRLACCS